VFARVLVLATIGKKIGNYVSRLFSRRLVRAFCAEHIRLRLRTLTRAQQIIRLALGKILILPASVVRWLYDEFHVLTFFYKRSNYSHSKAAIIEKWK